MVSIMNEALELKGGLQILEVGSGSGWHASTIAEIVAPKSSPKDSWGHVYTVEIVDELARLARQNIKHAGFTDRVTVICGDGSLGLADEAPFDRILVTAAAPATPKPLVDQLKDRGILLIPVGGYRFFQTLIRIRRNKDRISEENLGGVAFVPLTGYYGYKL